MAAMRSPRILLIDDYNIFRAGLGQAIRTAMAGTTIVEAGSVEQALRTAPEAVDLVLLDIALNGLNGLDGMAQLQRRWPRAPILVVSSHDTPDMVQLARERGAAGFVSKAAPAERLMEAIDLALRGQLSGPPPASCPTQPLLTPHQGQLLQLLLKGHSNKLIARQLVLPENTVRLQVQDLLMLLQAESRAEAVVAARRQGLVG
jgi:DNA-binding NarL/FixJ family response regulator